MDTRRWIELAAAFTTALVLGVLIGYGVARSTSPDVPERRYTVGHCLIDEDNLYFYRYDIHTGKTWYMSLRVREWKEIAEPNQGVSPPNEKK